MTTDWDWDIAAGDIDLSAHTGLLLAEDDALKKYLSGFTIPVKDGMSEVDVFFRYPEGERRTKYPFITIDFLTIAPAFERWTSHYHLRDDSAEFTDMHGTVLRRGMYVPSTAPELPNLTDEGTPQGFDIDPYMAYKLTYQVSTFTRSALHDRYLMSRFMVDIFPPRPFFIGVDADATWRRCELVSTQQADTTETTTSGNKRIFRKVYTVTMEAEIPQSKLREVFKVLRVHGDIYDRENPAREPADHQYDDFHTVGEGWTVEPEPQPE